MRFFAAFLICICAVSLFAADKIFPYPYVQEDLPNGLRLITIPTDYPNLVSLFERSRSRGGRCACGEPVECVGF